MEFFSKETRIDFLGLRKPAIAVSLALIIGSFVAIGMNGLNFGIDFTGGVLLEIGYDEAVELDPIRGALAESGYPEATVQYFGEKTDVLVRLQPDDEESNADISTNVMRSLQQQNADAELRRVEFVGPQVGDELKEQGIEAMMFVLIGILIYISLRFQLKLAAGAVVALAHDVIITIGVFALFGIPFDLTVLAAVLAVIGYSLNDTIVIFDRIRENFRIVRKSDEFTLINLAINQNMSRTIMTGLTTLLVLVALYAFGGETVHGFALALIVGIMVGTYSSVYVASALAVMLKLTREDLLPIQEKDPIDDMP